MNTADLRRLGRRVLPASARRKVAGTARGLRNRFTKRDAIVGLWEGGLSEEIDYWRSWISTSGLGNDEGYFYRMSPDSPLQQQFRDLMANAGREVRLLDVGAGPVTSFGKVWPGHEVTIDAVDALADEYAALFAEAGVAPPVPTRNCHSEHLTDVFPPNTFDLALASNTLDHSYDPMAAIRQMVEVVKPGGTVLLRHHRNEAKNEHYVGLHQWNFDVAGESFLLTRPGERIDIGREIGGAGSLAGSVTDAGHGFITIVITKRS